MFFISPFWKRTPSAPFLVVEHFGTEWNTYEYCFLCKHLINNTIKKCRVLLYSHFTPLDAVIGVPLLENGTPVAYLQRQVTNTTLIFTNAVFLKSIISLKKKRLPKNTVFVNVFCCLALTKTTFAKILQ